MRRLCLLMIVLLSGYSLFAQSGLTWVLNQEGSIMAIPRYKPFEFKMPQFNYQLSYTPINTLALELKMPDFDAQTSLDLGERPMDMQVLSAAYRPFFNVYTPMLMNMSPVFLDYVETYAKPLSPNFAFVTQGIQETWPGAGGINTVSTTMAWNSDRWSATAGGYAGRYYTPFDASPGFMGGFVSSVSYQATDRIRFNMWGEYTMYDQKGKDNMFLYANPAYPHTTVGGSMDFKITEHIGIGVGLQHQFNPMRNKWERQPIVYPIFYQNKRIKVSAF